MISMFNHFLITRFNVPVWWSDKGCSEEWLNHRFDLFDKYCYPSVCGQTNKNFKWLVLFDMNIDRNRIKKYNKDVFSPVFMEYFSTDLNDINHCSHKGTINIGTVNNQLPDIILKDSKEADYIVTTRLDNDDGIGSNFIKGVQDNWRDQEEILNMPYGCKFYKNTFYPETLESNPFMTMVERKNIYIKTVYGVPHWIASEFMPLRQICKEGLMWNQVIHSKNHTNQIGFSKPILDDHLWNHFNIDKI